MLSNTICIELENKCLRFKEIVVGSNMDKIYIVMDYVEHDLKALMETMTQPFLVGKTVRVNLQNCNSTFLTPPALLKRHWGDREA